MRTRRLFLIVISLISIVLLSACNVPSAANSAPTPEAPTLAAEQPTLAPTQAALPTAAAKPTQAASSSGAGCGNPYFPDKAGSTWTFANTMTGVKPSTMVRTLSALSASGLVVNDEIPPDIKIAITWSCKDGNMTMLNSATVSSASMEAQVKNASATGYLIPGVIAAGKTWSEKLAYETSAKLTGKNPSTIDQQNDVQIDCKGDGQENVQVTAGSFDALKVTCTYVLKAVTTINGKTGKAVNITYNAIDWYVAGVGSVKTLQSGDIAEDRELTSYKIP